MIRAKIIQSESRDGMNLVVLEDGEFNVTVTLPKDVRVDVFGIVIQEARQQGGIKWATLCANGFAHELRAGRAMGRVQASPQRQTAQGRWDLPKEDKPWEDKP